jgi:RNA polymerase sigma-70 factor (ECF subfamily)
MESSAQGVARAPDDAALAGVLRRMAEGDRDALRRFVQELGPWIHGALLRLCGSSVAAAVLLEDSLAEIWTLSPLYDRHLGSPSAWAMAVAREKGLAWRDKRRGREGRLKTRNDTDPLLPAGPAATVAARALGGLDESRRERLRHAWFEGVTGASGGAAAAERSALAEDLRAWAAGLTSREGGA